MAESQLAHTDRGVGESVLLLPPLGARHTIFDAQVDAFAGTHRVVAATMRGTGASPALRGPAQQVLPRQAHDVVGLMDQLGIATAHIVGVSYGGLVAQELVLEHRDRCRTVTVCDSYSDTRPRTPFERIARLSDKLTPLTVRLPKAARGSYLAQTYRAWPGVARALASHLDAGRGHELILQHRAAADVHNLERLASIDIAALAMVGDHLPQAISRMRLTAQALQTTVELIPQSTDPSNVCQPKRFNALLGQFLSATRHSGG